MNIREIDVAQIDQIKTLFFRIFTGKPWNDDWSNPVQLHSYIMDIIGNPNSLSFGLFDEDELIGLSLGLIMHWHAGTEYYILEFGLASNRQGEGLGSLFMREIEHLAKEKDVTHIFLQTERTVPAYDFYTKNGFTELADHVSMFKFFNE